MKQTNSVPTFTNVYKSMSNKEKRRLVIYYTTETGKSEDTWFRKVRINSFDLLEQKLLASKLRKKLEDLFPEPAFQEEIINA